MSERIAVLGAGSWGISIANLLHGNGHRVRLWEYDRSEFEYLVSRRSHEKKLPGITLPDEIDITNDLMYAVSECDYILFVVPAQRVRQVCEALNRIGPSCGNYINLAKGIEVDSTLRMSEVIETTISLSDGGTIATLSGPSHAEEVARSIPTSVVVASKSMDFARVVQDLFNNRTFRVYRSTDLIGVELGGSLKNVIAIASGIVQGLGLGDNTLGALMTRGMAEITRMGIKLGAVPLTFTGLSGIGDLITTCISRHSRNRYVGERIGRGERLDDILKGMVMVAEGVDTCRSALAMSLRHEVEMPITCEIYKVLFQNKSPAEAVVDLMSRPLKEEVWS
jgi:glycerol-3-phosphate dehydrogenase (NAD(P)+)